MIDAVILDAVRTPIGRHGGALARVRPDDLAAIPIRALVERTGIDPSLIEEVILGCANQAGEDNRNVARMAAILAGLPRSVAGVTMNRLCASGLAAVNAAARAIKAGEGDVYVAGGVESMSRAPYSVPKKDSGFPTGNVTAWDTTLGWRYPNPAMEAMFPLEPMGETAENLQAQSSGSFAPRAGSPEIPGGPITREEQDAFALESQRRAVAAIDSGRFRDEIVPVRAPGRGGEIVVERDEHPRYRVDGERVVLDTDLASLAKLKPAFRKNGSVTAGNSSGLNDGAAALLLASAAKAKSLGLRPLARIVASAAAGVDPQVMGIGPVPAVGKALARAGITMRDVGLIELNEAFAVQSIAVMRAAGMRHEITNVNGGAIALGHPLGASGARILTTLVHEMRRRNAAGAQIRYGLATLCVGVGQGDATVVEWLGSMSSPVRSERRGDVAVVSLDRPDKRNAIDRAMVDALHAACVELETSDARAMVLTAVGDTFASGADIAELRERTRADALAAINSGLFRRIERLPMPTIAAVKGYALGGGCELAMACDLRVAGEGARFGQPEAKLGIIAGAGGGYRLRQLVGLGRARELLFTGRIVKADEALRIGLVERVVPDERVLDEALALATEIAQSDPLAIRLTKLGLGLHSSAESEQGGRFEIVAQAVTFESAEKRRRMTEFLERKKKT